MSYIWTWLHNIYCWKVKGDIKDSGMAWFQMPVGTAPVLLKPRKEAQVKRTRCMLHQGLILSLCKKNRSYNSLYIYYGIFSFHHPSGHYKQFNMCFLNRSFQALRSKKIIEWIGLTDSSMLDHIISSLNLSRPLESFDTDIQWICGTGQHLALWIIIHSVLTD